MNPTLLQRVSSRPTGKTLPPRSTLKSITTAAAVALLAAFGLSRAEADTYTATNEAELYKAVADANANPGLDTINLVKGRVYRITQFLEFNDPTIVNGNGATLEGGGYNWDWFVTTSIVLNSWSGFGEVTLNEITISGVSGGYARAIIVYERTLTLNNSSVSGNAGAGILNIFGTVTLNSSTISENTAASEFDYGGIMNSGTLVLNNSTVTGNTGFSGAGILAWAGTVTLNDGSSVHHNTSNYGAGIHVYNYYNYVTVTLNDASSIHHNTAVWGGGGGIYSETAAFTLNLNGGSNITKNTATTDGGGIYGAIGTLNLNTGKIFKTAPNDYGP